MREGKRGAETKTKTKITSGEESLFIWNEGQTSGCFGRLATRRTE
jgi:hypothetical protein